jgi:WD40 repeat protein/tRNA A-37 threonylcarbamoyl transferase component Bud32
MRKRDGSMPSETANTLPGPTDSAVQLVQLLAQYRLLEPAQQQEAADSLQTRFPEPRRLAHELIQRGWLTPYQVNQLFLGKGAQLVLGSYVILERLGEGGMGQVFKARHQNLGRTAALKVIRKDRLSNPVAVQRFRREIQAVAHLSHPNVVIAFDADQVGDIHYFSMEYVEGIDLGRLLKTQGPLPIEVAHQYLRQAALGLQHAHERGLVHRDIKPSNLLLAKPQAGQPLGVVKVLDLGLARLERPIDGDLNSSLSNDGQLMGTPDFIAPEQARNSHRIDARADLYSLGCTFYYLLTGQVPFQSDTATEKLYKHWFEEARPIEQLRPEASGVLAVVIRRLMAKRPEDRYQSAAALVAALDGNEVGTMPALDLHVTPVASTAPVAVAIAVPAPPATESAPQALPQAVAVVPTAHTPPSLPGGPDPRRRRRLIMAAAGGVGLLVLFGLILLITRSGKTALATTARAVASNKQLTREQQADTELLALLTRFGDRKTDADALRRDLLAFRQTYADLPVAVQAAEKVTRLPSPLDQLPGRIPPEERFEAKPKQLVAVLGERRWRHWGPVYAVALSPDARTVASGGQDGVRLWNAKTGQEQNAFDSSAVAAVAYSADGKRLVSLAGDGAVTSWDLNADPKGDPVPGPTLQGATTLTLSGDGLLAAAAQQDGVIVVWSAATGKEVATLRNGTPVSALAFAPDGNTLASAGGDKAVHLWNLASGRERGKLEGHGSPVRALAFSADGQTLASGGDDYEIRLWDVLGKKTRSTLTGHQATVSALVFVRDDKILASGDTSGTVRLWRQGSNREPVLRGHTAAITSLAARRQGATVVSASLDGSLRAWDLVDDEESSPLAGHAGAALAVAFAPDCKLVATGSSDATLKLWEVPTLKDRTLRGHTNGVRALSFSGDGQRLASGGWDGLVKLWDPSTGLEKTTLAPHRGQVNSVAYALDGRVVAAGSSASEPNPARGTNIDVGEVKLWEVPANRERANLRTIHRHGVSAVALAANGKVGASGSWDGTVRLWDAPSGRDRGTLEVGVPVECVAFGPSSAILAAGCRNGPNNQNGQVRLWDVASQKPRGTYTAGYTGTVTGLAFSPDGHLLVGADSDGNIIVWDLASSRQYEVWKVPGAVLGVAFASDGRHIATANANSTTYIFRLKAYQPRW